MNKDEENGFARGVAYVIALMRRDGCMTESDVLRECGMTLKDYEASEVEEYDLKEVREIFNELKDAKRDR